LLKKNPYTIIYNDERIIAVNKASGISVGGERWDESALRLDQMLSELTAHKIFTVHRIDKDTSGLVIFAKDHKTHKKISAAFESRSVEKKYIAVVHGRPSWKETSCDLPLVPDGNKKHLTIIDNYRGKPSLTKFTLLCFAGNYSVLEALPETGRTHQIRVHLAALGHPVVCDELYGNRRKADGGVYLSSFKRSWRGDPVLERPLLSRLGLHAAKLVLPAGSGSDDGLSLEAPLPRDMAALLRQMEQQG
jgi:23S rRNA pseudouridine1911/1915/1917 synthase